MKLATFDTTSTLPRGHAGEPAAVLAGVTIERLRWQDFIRRYNRPETLF
jgi:hypothetical protein